MPTTITEATTTADLAPVGTTGGLFRVRVIDAGMGSSGYYPAETLEAAGRAGVVKVGTHAYFDHPSESEMYDRPERSVRDLAAVFKSTGTYDPATKAIEADVQVFGPYRELFADPDFREAIGMSIRAMAEVEEGDVDGRRVPVVKTLESITSVDFVTHAGRGGKMLQLLESARDRVSGRAIRRGVTEATANDTRDRLQQLLQDAYGGGERYVWVRDFDDTTVWFEDTDGLWQQARSADGIAGVRVSVRQVTTYVPIEQSTPATAPAFIAGGEAFIPRVNTATTGGLVTYVRTAAEGATSPTHVPPVAPAGSNPQESEEDTMPQIEEARLRQLEEAAGRVQTLESERDAAVQRATDAETALSEARATARTSQADAIVSAADADFTALERRGLLADLPVTESGDLDADAFKKTVDEAATTKAEEAGAGRVTGFGSGTSTTGDISEADLDRELAGIFGRQTTKEA